MKRPSRAHDATIFRLLATILPLLATLLSIVLFVVSCLRGLFAALSPVTELSVGDEV